MHPIFIQAGYYAIVLFLGFFIVAFIQRGFFLKFLRVKISFGRLIMVKVKSVNRDHYSVGRVEDNFLLFKLYKDWRRLTIPGAFVFYRSLGVSWVDIDEERNALCCPDYSTLPGYDAVKFSDLLKRALQKPAITDNKDKLVFAGLLLIIILIAFMFFFLYKHDTLLKSVIPMIQKTQTATVTAATI